MKKYRGWLILLIFAIICAGGVWLTLQVTAEYPALGEAVSYPVNQVDGFELSIEKPTWSPFKGYTIRWAITANSKEIYSLVEVAVPALSISSAALTGNGIVWHIRRTHFHSMI